MTSVDHKSAAATARGDQQLSTSQPSPYGRRQTTGFPWSLDGAVNAIIETSPN